MNLKEIEKLIQLILGTDIEEIDLKRGEDGLRVRRHLRHGGETSVLSPLSSPSAPISQEGAPQEAEKAASNLLVIRSPLVGTFYRSSSPDVKPFVEIGDAVSRGQVLCIVEAMKLMNEIECEADGRIAGILVENGRPVEYGEPLMEIEPAG